MVWEQNKSEEEIAEIERKFPNGVCHHCVDTWVNQTSNEDDDKPSLKPTALFSVYVSMYDDESKDDWDTREQKYFDDEGDARERFERLKGLYSKDKLLRNIILEKNMSDSVDWDRLEEFTRDDSNSDVSRSAVKDIFYAQYTWDHRLKLELMYPSDPNASN
jgi:hypothetical protein